MNENKKYAKNLVAGDWIRLWGSVYAVRETHDYGNGHWCVMLSDGRLYDCLGYTTLTLA